jgi:hypothetical protein
LGGLTPLEKAPLERVTREQAAPEQAPLELMTNEAMFRAFGLLSPPTRMKRMRGTRLARRRRTGVSTRIGLKRTGVSTRTRLSRMGVSTRMGPTIGSYF